ncbi:RNA-directed DNA polymerase, eukaryota, partial [Tanacetum coccineum]
VDNLERLIGNLCTLWIGRFRLQANPVKFQREPRASNSMHMKGKDGAETKSFASALGKIKDSNALPNLYDILHNEGFADVKLSYLGGDVRLVWTAIEGLPICAWNKDAIAKIVSPWGTLSDVDTADDDSLPYQKVCVATKVSTIINDRIKIIVKGKIYWIRIRELEAWSPEFEDEFCDTSSIEESVREEKNGHIQKEDLDHVSESSCMKENNEAAFIKKARTHEVQSEDPFEIYDLFKKKATKEATQDDDPSHPPGFMPKDDAAKEKEEAAYSVNQFSNNGNSLNKATKEATQDDDPSHPPGFTPKDDAAKEKEEAAYSVNQFSNNGNSLNNGVSRVHSGVNRSFSLKSGGSIMDVIENLVDIGQTMGYNMEGCLGQSTKKRWIRELNMKNKINFDAFQETKLESIDLFSIKELWGNFSFDFTFSPSVGFSGGILCVWDPNIFVKDNATISDSFVAVRGDINEVRSEHERFGTIFNVSGAKAFNHFISASDLIDLPLEAYSYTWSIKSASKMTSIKAWCKDDKQRSSEYRLSIQSRLSDLDKMIDSGHSNEDLVNERTPLLKELHNINKCHSLDMASKDKGDWIDKPYKVKNEFLNNFYNRFARPTGPNIVLDSNMFKQLSSEQIADLECDVTYDEIKRAVWDCGTNKSPGPDGFTFDFIRTYWKIINQDVVNVVREFFVTSKFPPGSNSSFIALIPKKQDAKLVKDFRPISLIGCFYKIIAKILANRLSMVISDLISDVQSAFVPNRQILDGPFILNELISWCKFHKSKAMIFKVDFEKAFDSVRWDYLDGILSNFGFGSKWREWIHGCLTSAMGSIKQ